jgi:hypothetical protein
MRYISLIALLSLAACGGGEAEKEKSTGSAARPAAGQWELTSEVTAFRTVDGGAPKIDTPVGTRATETVCVGAGQQLPTAAFSGENYRCNYENYYVRNGRINVTMQCVRDDLSGGIPMTVDGSFEENSITYTRNLRTVLATDGDVEITARVTARRTGECAPEPADGNQANAATG